MHRTPQKSRHSRRGIFSTERRARGGLSARPLYAPVVHAQQAWHFLIARRGCARGGPTAAAIRD
eukprot:6694907-Pyramimonas_sp.AAC.1